MGHLSGNCIHTPTRKAFLRFWALLLSLVTVFSLVPAGVAAETPKLQIAVDGVELDDIYMTTRERVVLEAHGAEEGSAYQWQILHPESDSSWISIYDGIRQELSVTMALAKNMLRPDGTVQLRCRATAGDSVIYSDPVTVHITEPQPAQTVAVSSEPATQDTLSGAEGDGEIPEFVTVTIEYIRYDYARDDNGDLLVDSDGNFFLEVTGQAFLPYVATLQGGNPLKDTEVTNPTMVGYSPYYNGAPSSSILLNFDSVVKDEHFTVEYRPSLVDYSVRYFLQNVYDDLYVEDAGMYVETEGHTGTTPPREILNKEKEGFTALYYQPDFIAADGSTVFEVYYERNYYLMEFDCDGGYGTESLYVRYGSYISIPQPVKPGWSFVGWDRTYYTETVTNAEGEDEEKRIEVANGVKDDLPETLPAYNSGYKAIWATTDTDYTIVFWTENADDGYYSYKTYTTVSSTSSTALDPLAIGRAQNPNTVKGFDDAEHFTLNEARTQLENPATVIVEGDGSTIINLYYSRKTYTLNFIDNSEDCIFEPHVHTDACYEYYCNSHVHTAACYTCGKVDHIHTGTCCTITEHPAHTIACYTNSTDYTVISDGNHLDRVDTINNPTAGNVYRYRRNGSTYYNYFFDGTTWYLLGGADGYSGISHGTINNPNTNGQANSAAATMICTTPLHTHGTGCNYGCNLEPHAHTPSCFLCGTTEHIHDGSCCSITPHTHSIVCYNPNNNYSLANSSNTGYSDLTAIPNPQEGYVYKYRSNRYGSYGGTPTYSNYFYDGNTWYYLGTSNSYCGLISTMDNPEEHGEFTTAKSTKSISCGESEHDHSSGCNYSSCTIPAHAHTGDCFHCGQHHVHNALCDRHRTCLLTEHVHTDDCHLVYSITAKYDANITSVWESDPVLSLLQSGIVWKSSVTGKYYSFLEKMPGQNIDLSHTLWEGNTYTWHYYLEVGPNETVPEEKKLQPGDGRTYKFYHTTTVMGSGISLTYEEDYFPITGYTQRDNTVPDFENRTANLFYTINSWQLEYINHSVEGPTPTKKTLTYGDSLASHQISKEIMQESYYPKNLEPGAYEFGGWYTSPGCFDGSEVDWENGTMPDRNEIIYAKWTPILRNVTFYKTYDDMKDKTTPFLEAKDVPHGELLGSAYNQQPTAQEGYRFIGWFYMDDENKKRFAPDSMEITRDLELFAEWATTIDTTYDVTYVLKDDVTMPDPTDPGKTVTYPAGTVIADEEFNHITVGKTKTFQAKGGTHLYPAFRQSIFPTTNSHSILMKESGSENTFEFEYVYDSEVWYKVQYLDYQTRTPLASAKVDHTNKAIITEKFLPIKGYRPTGFYVTQALASDGEGDGSSIPEENVLTFLYIKDEDHGMFSIEHYLENPNSTDSSNRDNYTLYESEVGSSDVNKTITGHPRTYTGFSHNDALNYTIWYEITSNGSNPDTVTEKTGNVLFGPVTYAGLTIKIYYSRQNYPYIIEYREHGVDEKTDPLKRLNVNGADVGKTDPLPTQKYDSELTHTAEESFTLDGINYEYYIPDSTEADRTKTTDIRVATNDSPNKLIFYYTKKKIPVHYHAVCTEEVESDVKFGAVSIASESAASAKALGGSTPMPASGFVFKGWFQDEACTVPVDETWVDTTKGSLLKPEAFTLEEGLDEDHYYALFAPVTRDLRIVKDGVSDTADSFLFSITGTNALGQKVNLTVSIQGSGEVTVKGLYCGTYTVTELTGWSWNYACAVPSQEVTLTVEETGMKTVTFTNTYQQPDWLTDEARAENQFS